MQSEARHNSCEAEPKLFLQRGGCPRKGEPRSKFRDHYQCSAERPDLVVSLIKGFKGQQKEQKEGGSLV